MISLEAYSSKRLVGEIDQIRAVEKNGRERDSVEKFGQCCRPDASDGEASRLGQVSGKELIEIDRLSLDRQRLKQTIPPIATAGRVGRKISGLRVLLLRHVIILPLAARETWRGWPGGQ